MGRGRVSSSRMWKKKKMMKINPTFFKVLVSLGDFPDRLRVPPVFVKNYFQGSTLPSKVHLMTSRYSGHSSVSWGVEMEKNEDGCYIAQGWHEIVKDLGLQVGDFLVFELLDDTELGVVPYAPTCCEKRIDMDQLIIQLRGQEERSGVKVKTEEGDDDDDDDDDDDIQIDVENSEEEGKGKPLALCSGAGRPSSSAKKRNLFFEKSLTKTDMKFFTLPTGVATEAEQWTKRSAVIRGPGGRKWNVALKLRNTSFRRLDVSTGWGKFIKDTGLSVGDTVRFGFLGGWTNVIEARVLSKASTSRPKFNRGNRDVS